MKNHRKTKRTGHVVSHIHWDREWRWPIWESTLKLVGFMDHAVEALETSEDAALVFDGQTIAIEDYLAVRPEMRSRIQTLVKGGKLQVGPWLVLPDQHPLDPECLVRNLLFGHRSAEELGVVFKVGYTTFGWGQIAQLPQIYAGFGINIVTVAKRVDPRRAPQSEFLWQSPDGTQVLATRFGEGGRHNFFAIMHEPAISGSDIGTPDWVYRWGQGRVAYHRADPDRMEQDHFDVSRRASWHPERVTSERIEELWRTTDDSVLENDRLMMQGIDYGDPFLFLKEIIERINAADPDPRRQWFMTTIPRFLEIFDKIDRSKLHVIEGELRDGPALAATCNALANRAALKRLNKRAENLLIRFAEPLTAIAALLGAQYEDALMKKAWRFLIESHSHDSINGVTQDKTVADVRNRLEQTAEIAQTLGDKAMQDIVARLDLADHPQDAVLLVAFNPLPYPRREILEAWATPPDRPEYAYSWLTRTDDGIQVYNADGSPAPTQWEHCRKMDYPLYYVDAPPITYRCQRHKLFFDPGEIPAGGYKAFYIGPSSQGRPANVPWSDSSARTGALLRGSNTLENEHLRVEMNANGTFDLLAKDLDLRFPGLNCYEDRGEHGNYWMNVPPRKDEIYTSHGGTARIWSEASGPLHATLVSETTMRVPKRGIREQQRRGDALEDLVIRTAVTLEGGARAVAVTVDFENRIEDHCLRVLFPTGYSAATHAEAGGHFHVDSRPIRVQGPTDSSTWPAMAMLPFSGFVDVSDGATGLAIINDSLTEYEVLDDDTRTVALTLIKAVHNWIWAGGELGSEFPSQKGGQALGPHTIRYAILPHAGTWQNAQLPMRAQMFGSPVRLAQTSKHKGSLSGQAASFFAITNPNVQMAAFKKAEDRPTFVVRLYNPTSEAQETCLAFAAPIARAWFTNLNEERLAKTVSLEENQIRLSVPRGAVVTVEIEPRSKG